MASGFQDIDDIPSQHIRLFAPWIFDEKNELLKIYADVLDKNDLHLLADALAQTSDERRIQKLFSAALEILREDRKARNVLRKFLDNYADSNVMQQLIMFNDSKPEAFKIYKEKFLRSDVIDKYCATFHLPTVVEYLSACNETDYRLIGERIKKRLENDVYAELWRLRCELLVSIVRANITRRKPEWWYMELLKACNTHPKSRAFAAYLDKNFKDSISNYEIELQQFCQPAVKKVALDFVNDNDKPEFARPQYLFGQIPKYISGEMIENHALRGYQLELVAKAKLGQSTIICAPTGSGKTVVALDIVVNHLRQKKFAAEVGRVAIFVPTIPLVNQQHKYLSANLAPEFYTEKLSGSERAENQGVRKASTILLAHVIVLTPQIFINMLCSPLKSQKLYITDFSMFVFDECHHCDEAHPYNIVMNYVRQSDFKPQIIGLTASVSSSKDQNARFDAIQAIDLMLNLCARLNVDTITSVRNESNLIEMYSHIAKTLDEIMPPFKPSPRDDFAHQIALISDYVQSEIGSTLQETLADIADMKKEYIDLPIEGHNGVNGKSKTSVLYNGKLAFLKQMISKKDINDDRRFFLLKCIEVLEICHFTLRNNELMPASFAFEYMCERMDDLKLEFGSNAKFQRYADVLQRILNFIREKYEILKKSLPDSETKPILNALIGCIGEQYTKDRTSRIIIFVESRKGCIKMAEYFQEHPVVTQTFGRGSVGYLVSVNQSHGKFGQTPVAQEQTLQRFRNGQINILFATSVAEEGLNVAECNLIIKYNTAGSDTSYIQRRGRARAKNSRSILLAIESRITEREFVNIRKEFLMNECLKHVQAMNESELQRAIHDKKSGILTEMKNEEDRLKRIDNNLYQLRCISCPTVICYSNEISRLNDSQYVCCNPYAWKDSTIKERVKVFESNKLSACCGEWVCNCGQKRGEVIKFGEAYLPLIAADCFRLEKKISDINYQPIELKKQTTWKTIRRFYFIIGLIAPNQIRNMISALEDHNSSSFQVAESSETKAILESLKEDNKRKEKFVLKDSN